MAMFFKSFRNSAMVRRLVLYGLSKLDLFEEHALDLENFELAWGRNTVIEFKDVGMKVQVWFNNPLAADKYLERP